MPKFPDDQNLIFVGMSSFTTATQMNEFNFNVEEFEQEADALDKQYPGEGYQRAYNGTVMRLFDAYVSKCMRMEDPGISLADMVYYFDSFVMNSYIAGAKKHGIDANFETNGKTLKLETLRAFDEALERIPNATVLDETYKKFKRNELTLDSVAADLKARKKTVPTRAEALELISRAAFLEERNEQRGFLGFLRHPFIYIKELLTISSLKNLASKVDDVESLEQEAEIGNVYLAALRAKIDTGRIIAQSKVETARIEAKAAGLAEAHADMENGLDFDELDKNAASFNGVTDLGEIDDAFTTEDEESATLNDGDISFHMDDEAITVGGSGEVIPTYEARLPDDSAALNEDSLPDFGNESVVLDEEPDKISIVIDELSGEDSTVQKSERVNDKEVLSAPSISIN